MIHGAPSPSGSAGPLLIPMAPSGTLWSGPTLLGQEGAFNYKLNLLHPESIGQGFTPLQGFPSTPEEATGWARGAASSKALVGWLPETSLTVTGMGRVEYSNEQK